MNQYIKTIPKLEIKASEIEQTFLGALQEYRAIYVDLFGWKEQKEESGHNHQAYISHRKAQFCKLDALTELLL